MSKIGIIVSGGTIHDAFVAQIIKNIKPDVLIGVDRGLEFLYRNQISPTHIVGDFDSVDKNVIAYYKEQTEIPIRQFHPVKDATDTEIALQLAMELGAEKIRIFGATGTRIDHVMANIQILSQALENGVEAYIEDCHNRISLWQNEIQLTQEERFGTYFSIFPFGGMVEDVTVEGAKYPLTHYCMTPYESRTVSNEYKDGDVRITFPKGTILLIEASEE